MIWVTSQYLSLSFQIKWTIYLLHGDRFAPSLKNQIRRHCYTARQQAICVLACVIHTYYHRLLYTCIHRLRYAVIYAITY